MHRLLPAIALLASMQASAGPDTDLAARWVGKCKGSAIDQVEAVSPSGTPVEDDMTVSLVWSDGVKAKLPLPRAWYVKRNEISSGNLGCEGVAFWPQANGFALLAIAFDGRPGGAHAAVVLLDLPRQAVLDQISDVGELVDPLKLIRTKEGWVLSVVTGSKLAKSGGEESVTSKRRVSVRSSKLALEWLR